MLRLRLAFVLSLAGLLLGGFAIACSVPVFRYALERWRHDKRDELFRVTVFNKGQLSPEDLATLRHLDPEDGPRTNWFFDVVDVAGMLSPEQETLWKAQKNPTLPWAVVRGPEGDEEKPALYQGPLDRAALTALIDSPARRTVAGKLLNGDSVVWVMIESGDKERDDAVAEMVRKELARLEKVIALPDPDDDTESVLRSKVPLRISFPLVRLSRQAAGEEAFLHQLLTLDKDHSATTGPILVPIFGRGRMLTTYADKEITRRGLEEACRFLCGACSCRVKMANPGADLLWIADWDSILADRPEPERPAPAPEPIPLTKKPPAEVKSGGDWGRTLLIGGISVAATLVLLTGWLAFRLSRGT
jgi:hypothetical protein